MLITWIITMPGLTSSLRGQSKHAEAEQMLREMLDARRHALGPDWDRSLLLRTASP